MCGLQPSALRNILFPGYQPITGTRKPPTENLPNVKTTGIVRLQDITGKLLNLPRLGSQPIADIFTAATPPCLMTDAELAQAIENLPEKD